MKDEENSVVDRDPKNKEQETAAQNEKINENIKKITVVLKKIKVLASPGTPWDLISEIGFADAFFLTTKRFCFNPCSFSRR